jgi:hypothetical protein
VSGWRDGSDTAPVRRERLAVASSSNDSSAILKIVAVLLVVAALFVGYRIIFAGEAPGDEIQTVCVATGKTYWMSRDDLLRIPAQNPDTGQRTLLPCVERDGGLFVISRYRDALEGDSLKELNRYVDSETLQVKDSL